MRDHEHSSGILLEVIFQPLQSLQIQVVRRLVKQQQIRLLQQQPAQCKTGQLSPRQKHRLLGLLLL